MLERRPVWGLILGLNVCVVIWRISVQEPAMLEAEFEGGAGVGVAGYAETAGGVQQLLDASGYSHNKQTQRRSVSGSRSFVGLAEQQQLYAGKHLLAERFDKSENMAKGTQSAIEATSDESKRVNSLKHKNKSGSGSSDGISQHHKVPALNPTTSFANSTPTPLVTAATLRSVAESQPSTTTTAAAIEQLELPPDDFGQLIDLYNFTYLMSQDRCAAHIEALILVHSAPGNVEKRMDIRHTWGAVGQLPKFAGITPIRVVFLLGAVGSKKLQSQLEHENAQFGDMVQGSFIDNYRNMTYKHVVALKWFLYNCAHAQFLMKVDDDVYVNTPQLLIYLYNSRLNNKTASNTTTKSDNNATTVTTANTATAAAAATHTADDYKGADYSSKSHAHIPVSSTSAQFNAPQVLFRHPQNLLFCEVNVDAKVKRTYRSKWRVTRSEYASRTYPPYCSGYAIIYSPDVVLRLYKAAQRSKYFWIDDVHITGVLAQQLGINVTRSQAYILYEENCRKLLDLRAKSSDVDFVYAWHLVTPEQMRSLWVLYSALAMQHLTPSVYEEATSLLSPELEGVTKYVAASEHAQKITHLR